MPTIKCSYNDLCSLVGKKFKEAELVKVLEFAKAELDSKEGDTLSVEFNDTNQPYLWSVEGLARHLRAAIGKSKGFKELRLEKSDLVVNVDKSVSRVRPYIAFFLAKGPALTEYQLDQLIQLQEKIASSFGRNRKKVGAGLFPARGADFPVTYKAVLPKSTSFIPLGMRSKLSLAQVLEKHPKGKEFGWILKDAKKYPVVLNSKREVLTLPPIINSETGGKVCPGDREILCEVTGNDLEAVNIASAIFAYAFADRGFKIYPAKVKYGSKSIKMPVVKGNKFKFDLKQVEKVLGLKLKDKELKDLLGRAQYNYKGRGVVELPCYRHDVMHSVDVIEDIAIMHGYDNFQPTPLQAYTLGGQLPVQQLIDTFRSVCVGFGYQEVWSAVLSSKELLYEKMNVDDLGTVEIENFMSATYSCVRSWILPILMDVLSKNRHVDYPQRIFEEGKVTVRNKDDCVDENHLAFASAHSSVSFTEAKQLVEALLRNHQLDYVFEEFDFGCFIPGRAARILVDKQEVGFIGELHPKVLEAFGLLVPVAGGEINLSKLKK